MLRGQSAGPAAGQLRNIGEMRLSCEHTTLLGVCINMLMMHVTLSRWSSGQPNNAEGNENCLAIIVKGTPGFNDVACHHRKPVICQQ